MDNDVVAPATDFDPSFRSAAQWMMRLRRQEVESMTLCEFANWLESSAENRQAFARCDITLELIERAASNMLGNGTGHHK